jgi:hypothetical protein
MVADPSKVDLCNVSHIRAYYSYRRAQDRSNGCPDEIAARWQNMAVAPPSKPMQRSGTPKEFGRGRLAFSHSQICLARALNRQHAVADGSRWAANERLSLIMHLNWRIWEASPFADCVQLRTEHRINVYGQWRRVN